jgi:hypothetical protein
MASAILFAGVLAVISAITSGQKKAFEAEQQVIATLAAEELLGKIATETYGDLESNWQGIQPASGFFAFVSFTPVNEDLSDLGVIVSGKKTSIKIYPSLSDMRLIVELEHFIPEPQS